MLDIKNLVGSIKKIHVEKKHNNKIIDAMIVDYIYNPELSKNKQHKIDYVTTTGLTGNLYVTDDVHFTDIEVDEYTEKHLNLIKEALLRRKKAQEIYTKETDNIKNLVLDLLKEDNILSTEDFEKEVTSKLKEKGIERLCINTNYGKTVLTYNLNSNVNLGFTLKKHCLTDTRVDVTKNTNQTPNDLGFISKTKGKLSIENKDEYNEFINKYRVLDSSDNNLINLLDEKNLYVSCMDYLTSLEGGKDIYYKCYYTINKKNKKDAILLNNNTINMILKLSDFIKRI